MTIRRRVAAVFSCLGVLGLALRMRTEKSHPMKRPDLDLLDQANQEHAGRHLQLQVVLPRGMAALSTVWPTGLALNSGEQLVLRLLPSHSGWLMLDTINPHGVHSDGPIWRAWVSAGETVDTETLRLQGARGLELLIVTQHMVDGKAPIRRPLQIWHA